MVTSITEIGPEFGSHEEKLSREELDTLMLERVLRTDSAIAECYRLAARLAPDHHSAETARSACRRTLLGGKSRTWMAMLHHAGRLEAADADKYFADFEKYASAIKSGHYVTTESAASNVFELMHREATMGRAFFIANRYMGLGPIGVQKGDKIAIIFGLRAPFILREEDGMYSLIADSYVHGLMRGEAMDLTNISVQDIYLK